MKKLFLLVFLSFSLVLGISSLFSEAPQKESECKSRCELITSVTGIGWGDCMKACNSCKEPSLLISAGNRASCNCHFWEATGIFDEIGEELGFETHGECVVAIKPFFED
ncbi:MAG: hypothetical protein HKN68_09985 [Saprospiraceae bacterium]|nr:hypothetical protein [Saprospiraceae bacterium]